MQKLAGRKTEPAFTAKIERPGGSGNRKRAV